MKKLTSLSIALALLLNLSACGALFYPERINQHHSKKVDIKIAVADGIGLLFFIVPGVIAFAVDYHFGTIYLPARYGKRSTTINVVKSEQPINHDYLEKLIADELDLSLQLESDAIISKKDFTLDQVRLMQAPDYAR